MLNTTKQRTTDTLKLIEYAYKNFEIINIKELINNKFEQWKSINQNRIYVNKGGENHVELNLENINYDNMAVRKKDIDKIDIQVNCIFYLEAPINKNKILGNLKLNINNQEIDTLDIFTSEEIKKKSIQDYMIQFINILIDNELTL